MSENLTPDIRALPIAALTFSTTPAQAERRRHFSQEKLQELADSIKSEGLLQPIVVRPFRSEMVEGDAFEVVAGERRVRAHEIAGKEDILATVRELTDQQVAKIQLVENLQREDVHPLAEAEGYDELMKRHGYSADQVAEETGKSKAYIYARMKLLALCVDAREAYYADKLTASTALVIARIPRIEDQQRALKEVTAEGWNGRTMSYREAVDYVHKTFMLKLSGAPFARDDADLVPSAGACGPCPMRTGNQPELFGDVKGADVCTNPACFQTKKAAHVKRELEKAKETGERVIRGGEARRILPAKHGYWHDPEGAHKQLRNGYARPSDKCLADPKKRTYAELAGKDAPRVLLQNPDTGRVEKVFHVEAIADRLKAKGITPPKPAKSREEQRQQDQEAQHEQRQEETLARRAIFQAILKAAPTKLSREDLATIVCRQFQTGFGSDDAFYAALGWEMPKEAKTARSREKGQQLFRSRLLKLSDGELAQMAIAVTVIEDVLEDWGKPVELEALARRLGVDSKKIRAELNPPAPKADKKVAAKPSNKKAAHK